MFPVEPLINHAVPFMLVLSRLGGLFLFAPILSSRMVPGQVKVFLLLSLGAASYPLVSADLSIAGSFDVLTLAPIMLSETLIGLAIGLIASIPLAALELGGYLVSHQMGFGLAQVYNPAADSETDILGQLLFYIALATFIAVGGVDHLFTAILSTYAHLPIGLFSTDLLPLDLLLDALAAGFGLALRVAAPVLALIFLELLAMGFLMKTMPQMNVMTYGFAVKIISGLAILAGSLAVIDRVAGDEIDRVVGLLLDWSSALRPT